MLLELANVGYQIGAAGIVAFTAAFLVIVRWWTDRLGRMMAGVLGTTSGVLIMTTLRMLQPELATSGGYQLARLIMFWLFGIGVWSALASFIWAQFYARPVPPPPPKRMSTRREYRDEETDLADPRNGSDGDLHDRAGSADR